MTIIKEEQIKYDAVFEVAKKMMIAARTAPMSKGKANIVQSIVIGKDIEIVSDKMKSLGEKYQQDFFIRDAENILQAQALFLIGTKIKSVGLINCGFCGFLNCAAREKENKVPCAFNTGDLGIAVGSAVSVAMDNRVDNRIMYTVGLAIIDLGLLGKEIAVAFGIPLSMSTKNPFFDRRKFV